MQVAGRVVTAALQRETLCDRRNSKRCDSETQENTNMSKVGGWIRIEIAVFNKRIVQNKTIGGGSLSPVLLHGKNTTCRTGIYQDPTVE
jgi:hypothetical protein